MIQSPPQHSREHCPFPSELQISGVANKSMAQSNRNPGTEWKLEWRWLWKEESGHSSRNGSTCVHMTIITGGWRMQPSTKLASDRLCQPQLLWFHLEWETQEIPCHIRVCLLNYKNFVCVSLSLPFSLLLLSHGGKEAERHILLNSFISSWLPNSNSPTLNKAGGLTFLRVHAACASSPSRNVVVHTCQNKIILLIMVDLKS